MAAQTGGINAVTWPVPTSCRLKRISELAKCDSAIPLDAIAPFWTNTRIVSEEAFQTPRMCCLEKYGNLIVGAGELVYGRGEAPLNAALWDIPP